MKNENFNTSGQASEAATAAGVKPGLSVDALLNSDAQLWLLTAFATTIFWLPPF